MADGPLGNVLRRVRTLGAAHGRPAPTDRELLDRFASDRDEAAFAALVGRHGPMVLGICRRVLRNAHDAEDACQATFLVLARKAGSVRNRDALAGWVHGVACRVARRLKSDTARRVARECRGVPAPQADAAAEATWREVRAVLDEELALLPEAYRAALALCYLEGLTQDEAAGRLGWTLGALRGRLERGRERLRARLSRRGLSLGAVLSAASLAEARPVVPPALVVSTVKAAAIVAAKDVASAGGVVPARAAALTEGVLRAMTIAKLKAGALLLAAFLAAGALAYHQASAGPADTPAPAPPAAEKKPEGAKELAAIEKKLVGRWVGTRGFVVPTLTISADGTFRETILNETSEGTWALEWETLPPTLVRRYAKSDDKRLAGTTTKVKVVGLDESSLSFPNADDALRNITYRRAKTEPAADEKKPMDPPLPPELARRLELAQGKKPEPADEKKPETRKELLGLEKRLVGRWAGYADTHGEGYTFRADGTFLQKIHLGRRSGEGTWAFEWDALPPTLVLRITRSDDKDVPAGTVLRHKVVGLDEKRLAFENPNAVADHLGAPRPINYTRAKEAPWGEKQEGVRCRLYSEWGKAGAAAVLTAEIENEGPLKRPVHLKAEFHQVEVDGQLYAWAGSVTSTADPFPAGERREVSFALTGDWVRLDKDARILTERLKLAPGKHTVRVRMSAGEIAIRGIADPTVGPPVRVWSNPVEIEVAAPAVGPDGKPGEARDKKEDAAGKVLARLEGTWNLVEIQQTDGATTTGRIVERVKPLVISGKKWSNAQGVGSSGPIVLGDHQGGTLEIDPSKDPAHIDLACTVGIYKGKTQEGIFALDGDTLKICVGVSKRPSELMGKGGHLPGPDGQVLHVYRREKK
jgi:RNA polymerase sigma factor (sigma-70 family)